MTNSKIEWTGRSDWNPIRGCTRRTEACRNCYAEIMAARFSRPGQWGHGYAYIVTTPQGLDHRWAGKIEVQWDRAYLPLKWRKPALIFASSTSDFFHGSLIQHDIAHLWGVMIAAGHLRGHTFQVLTKRPEIARQWLNDPLFWDVANSVADSIVMDNVDPLNRRSDDARATLEDYGPANPPPNIWLGTSVHDQPSADDFIPHLLATPAAKLFVSVEPMLGPVSLAHIKHPTMDGAFIDALDGYTWHVDGEVNIISLDPPALDWVICGGESGPAARPMHPDWARSLRDQCASSGVPFFFKQWGAWLPAGQLMGNGRPWKPLCGTSLLTTKALSGHTLDGVAHREFPE